MNRYAYRKNPSMEFSYELENECCLDFVIYALDLLYKSYGQENTIDLPNSYDRNNTTIPLFIGSERIEYDIKSNFYNHTPNFLNNALQTNPEADFQLAKSIVHDIMKDVTSYLLQREIS